MLEGITANNTIFPICFMVCFQENIRTLTKFFVMIQTKAPKFWKWLDHGATTLLGDRGPGSCLVGVVDDCFELKAKGILRSCVEHILNGLKRQRLGAYEVEYVRALAVCETEAEVEKMLLVIKADNTALHSYIVHKSDYKFWVLAYVPYWKSDFYKVRSNMIGLSPAMICNTMVCHLCQTSKLP